MKHKPVIWLAAGTFVRAAGKENESTPFDQSDSRTEQRCWIRRFSSCRGNFVTQLSACLGASYEAHSLTRTRKRNMARRTQWLRQAGGRNQARGGGVPLLPTWLTMSCAVCLWACARRAHSGQRSLPRVPLKATTSSRPPWYKQACDSAAK